MASRYVCETYNIAAASEAQFSGDWSGIITTPPVCDLNADVTWSYNISGSTASRTVRPTVPLYVFAGTGYTIADGKFVINAPETTEIDIYTDMMKNSRGVFIYETTGTPYDVYVGVSTQNSNAFDVIYRVNGTYGEQNFQELYLYAGKWANDPVTTEIRLYGYADSNPPGAWAGYRLTMARGTLEGSTSNASPSTYPLSYIQQQTTRNCVNLRRCKNVA